MTGSIAFLFKKKNFCNQIPSNLEQSHQGIADFANWALPADNTYAIKALGNPKPLHMAYCLFFVAMLEQKKYAFASQNTNSQSWYMHLQFKWLMESECAAIPETLGSGQVFFILKSLVHFTRLPDMESYFQYNHSVKIPRRLCQVKKRWMRLINMFRGRLHSFFTLLTNIHKATVLIHPPLPRGW